MNFWIAIEGVLGCSTEHGDATCSIPPGATFIVDTYLDPLPSNFPAYGAFDVSLSYSGVIPNHDADTSAWPDCGFPASYYEPGLVQFGCAVGINAPGSTFSGLIGTSSFVCAESGNISLVHGRGSTDLVNLNDTAVVYSEDFRTSETLNISCDPTTPVVSPTGTPATATATPPPTFPPPVPRPAFDVNFWIAVDGLEGCSTEHGDATSDFVPSTIVKVSVYVGALPKNPAGYVNFDLSLAHSGLLPIRDPGGPTGGCLYDIPPDPNVVVCGGRPRRGFSAGPFILQSVRFDCVHSGTLRLVHGINRTELYDANLGEHAERANGGETLRINCGPADLPSAGFGGAMGGNPERVGRLGAACFLGGMLVLVSLWSERRRRRMQ